MSIIDIQEELGVNIPQSPEYDTIGAMSSTAPVPSLKRDGKSTMMNSTWKC